MLYFSEGWAVKFPLRPFLANVPILYPLKKLESLWFLVFLGGIEMGNINRKWVKAAKIGKILEICLKSGGTHLVPKFT